MRSISDFIPSLKDRAIFLGWVAGLVLLASLLWSFTYSFRAAGLMQVTNKILISMDDERRLTEPLSRPPAGAAPLGCWYHVLDSHNLFFVFAIMREGILVPCGAEITGTGEITIIPLGNHAQQLIERIPKSVLQIYTSRIESAVVSRGNR